MTPHDRGDRHGVGRTADCGIGTLQRAAGTLAVKASGGSATWGGSFTITVPIRYVQRPVDSRGRAVGAVTKTSAGHWTFTTRRAYHGWLWTVEWAVNGVAAARIAGSVYATSKQNVLTDGPFN